MEMGGLKRGEEGRGWEDKRGEGRGGERKVKCWVRGRGGEKKWRKMLGRGMHPTFFSKETYWVLVPIRRHGTLVPPL